MLLPFTQVEEKHNQNIQDTFLKQLQNYKIFKRPKVHNLFTKL